MDFQTFNIIYEGMHRILAKNMLRDFTIADYPYIRDRSAKRKLHRNVSKVSDPSSFEKRVVKTTELELV